MNKKKDLFYEKILKKFLRLRKLRKLFGKNIILEEKNSENSKVLIQDVA